MPRAVDSITQEAPRSLYGSRVNSSATLPGKEALLGPRGAENQIHRDKDDGFAAILAAKIRTKAELKQVRTRNEKHFTLLCALCEGSFGSSLICWFIFFFLFLSLVDPICRIVNVWCVSFSKVGTGQFATKPTTMPSQDASSTPKGNFRFSSWMGFLFLFL